MTRSRRLEPVQQVVDQAERRSMEELGVSERTLADSERKLADLKQYHADYQRGFSQRVASGMGGVNLRDYQLFLARLAEAIRQQTHLVEAARTARDAQRGKWQAAARRVKAIDHVVDTWASEERRQVERIEQRDSDERAQRARTPKLDS